MFWQSKAKKMLIFRFVGIFEYIILLMLILFLDMCPNSYGWMPSLQLLGSALGQRSTKYKIQKNSILILNNFISSSIRDLTLEKTAKHTFSEFLMRFNVLMRQSSVTTIEGKRQLSAHI